MVASLLASDPKKHDDFGNEIYREVSEVFGRQMEEDVSPVSKDDVAEVLRRRFFKPSSIRDSGAFRPHVTSIVGNIAVLDEQTQKGRPAAEERFLGKLPLSPRPHRHLLHPMDSTRRVPSELGEFCGRFAMALRDAEKWDTSPLIGPTCVLERTWTERSVGVRERTGVIRQCGYRNRRVIRSGVPSWRGSSPRPAPYNPK